MLGLMLKDFLNLKKQVKIIFFLLCFYLVFGVVSDDVSFFSSVFPAMILITFGSLVQTTFSLDDFAKWNSYVLTMPVTRKDIIKSKYALGFLFEGLAFILALILIFAITLFKGMALKLDLLYLPLIMLGVTLVYLSISVPITLKFGAERARMLNMGIVFVPSATLFFLAKLRIPAPSQEFLFTLEKVIPFVSVIFLGVVLYISYTISLRIMAKKEF